MLGSEPQKVSVDEEEPMPEQRGLDDGPHGINEASQDVPVNFQFREARLFLNHLLCFRAFKEIANRSDISKYWCNQYRMENSCHVYIDWETVFIDPKTPILFSTLGTYRFSSNHLEILAILAKDVCLFIHELLIACSHLFFSRKTTRRFFI